MTKNKERIEYLVNYLNNTGLAYDKGKPVISDEEWDNLYFELKKLEEETNIVLPNSPTQKIVYQVVSELKKVEHNHPMLSLDKTKNLIDIRYFLDNTEWVAMAKIDGLTCSLFYQQGKLVRAETRGDGKVGEDITHNAMVIPSIPKIIPYKEDFIVDGEIICTYEDFELFKNEYKNPRNFASGSIRLLDSKECQRRNLTFIVWDVITGLNENYLSNKFALCDNLFKVVPYIIPSHLLNSTDFIEDSINKIKEDAKELGYPIDGIVFKYNNTAKYEAAGRTDHHFKGGLAYKFYDETYETEVKDIEWTMGRTGQLTPVLVYNDIDIEGSVCNRASLHNISIMTKLMGGAYPGQRVFIYKANQIIPQVAAAQTNNPNHIPGIQIPKICPYCGEPTEIKKEVDSEVLYCTNPNCNGKLINRLDHFCGKKGLDIKGLSKKTLEKLIDWGWVNSLSDIFELKNHRTEWIYKTGFGEASVDKILKTIEQSKECDSDKFLAAVGIPLIGKVASAALMKVFHTYDKFREAVSFPAEDSEIYNIPGIGEVMIDTLINYDYTEADNIFDKYITEKVKKEENTNSSLEGKTFVITGKMKNYKNRDELKKVIEAAGGKVTGSVTSKTSYLINNDINSGTSKNVTAKKLGVPIITEEDFQNMLSN